MIPPSLLFFFKINSTKLGPLHFHVRVSLRISGEKWLLKFDRNCIEPVDHFEEFWCLQKVMSQNPLTQGIFLLIQIFFSLFCMQILVKLKPNKFCTYFVNFIPILFFDAFIVSCMLFISLSCLMTLTQTCRTVLSKNERVQIRLPFSWSQGKETSFFTVISYVRYGFFTR